MHINKTLIDLQIFNLLPQISRLFIFLFPFHNYCLTNKHTYNDILYFSPCSTDALQWCWRKLEGGGGLLELGAWIMVHEVLITFQLIMPIRVHSWRRKLIQHRAILFVYLPTCADCNGVNRAWEIEAFARRHNDGRRFNQTRFNFQSNFRDAWGLMKTIRLNTRG